MKIGVCFKIVPEFEEMVSSEWADIEKLDFSYAKKVYGCFDESALEMALSIRDTLKQSEIAAETVAVTAGVSNGAATDGLLRGILAAGFDDVVILPETNAFDPQHTALALASYFRQNPADMILTGRMVGGGDSGMVPVYLAEELGYELFLDAVSGTYNQEFNRMEVVCKEEHSLKTFAAPCGVVCTVGDAEKPYLRLFPMKARMEAKKRTFSRWEEIGTSDGVEVLLRNEQMDSKCQYLEGMDATAIAEWLNGLVKGDAV